MYALNYEGELAVKRLRRDAGARWLTSDSQDKRRFPDKAFDENALLIGRVICKRSATIWYFSSRLWALAPIDAGPLLESSWWARRGEPRPVGDMMLREGGVRGLPFLSGPLCFFSLQWACAS